MPAPTIDPANHEVEIFRAGTHTDSAGVTRNFSVADLDNTVSKFSPVNGHEPPVVIGHPKENAPAYGWVKGLARRGESLFAKLGDLNDGFVDLLKKKAFKKRSASFYPDGTLRHIGYLGAMPPAIKGLADFAFAEGEASTFEFMEPDEAYAFKSVGRVFGLIRDFFIEKFGLESTDKVLPKWEIDSLVGTQADERSSNPSPMYAEPGAPSIDNQDPNFSEPFRKGNAMDPKLAEALAKITNLETELTNERKKSGSFSEASTKAAADLAKANTELAALRTKVDADAKAARTKEYSEFCDKLVNEGRLAPNMKESTMRNLELNFKESEVGNFAEGEKKPIDKYRDDLAAMPVVIEFAEIATKTRAAAAAGKNGSGAAAVTAGDKLSVKTKEILVADNKLTFSEAFAKAQVDNPELAAEYSEEIRV